MQPFEFVVIGTPVSVQAKKRSRLRAWKERVKKAAISSWPNTNPPITSSVEVCLVYYYDQVVIDTDNIVKPILDSLIGLVYEDDRQVTDVRSSIRDINDSFQVKGMSRVLAEGFTSGNEFILVRITDAPDHKVLL